MSLPYSKPPPYERPNWHLLNAGQKRYAMEQYNLALVRRGAYFKPPVLEQDANPTDNAPTSHDNNELHSDPIADLDALDNLLDAINPSNDDPSEQLNRLNDLLDVLHDHLGGNEESADTQETTTPGEETARPGTSTGPNTRHRSSNPEEDYLVSGGMEQPQPDTHGTPPKRNKDKFGASVSGNVTGRQTSGSALPGTSGNTDGMTGAGGTGEDQSRAISTIPRGIHTPTYSWTFKKKHKFLSFGVANVVLIDTLTSGDNVLTRWALTTPLVNLPWEYAFMYMSPAEFERIQEFNGVFASRARVKVFQYNPRVAFQTADTTSTQATLNQNKFTLTAIGIRSNSNIWASDRDYTFATDEPMKPVGFQTTGNYTGKLNRLELAQHMYGIENWSAQVPDFVPSVCTGQELGLQRYLTVYAEKPKPPATGEKANDQGFPQFNCFCNEYNAMDMIGKELINEVHNFEYAPLKERANNRQLAVYIPGDPPSGTLPTNLPPEIVLRDGTRIEMPKNKIFPANGFQTSVNVTESNSYVEDIQDGGANTGNLGDKSNFAGRTMYTEFPMEQAGNYVEKNRKGCDYNEQQSIHMGVRPVPKLGTAVNLIQPNSWLDCQMYWTVECELEVRAADPFTFPRGNVIDIPARAQMCVMNTSGSSAVPQLYTYDRPYQYGRAQVVKNTDTV